MNRNETIAERLEYLRGEIRAERISMGELAELQSLAEHIDPGDVELLEPAGVPEFEPERQTFFVQRLAGVAFDAMETATRADGSEFTRKRDDCPTWVADVIREAHGEMFPDDYRYEFVRDAFGAIHDYSGDDLEDYAAEFADSTTDVYNASLIEWVGSNLNRSAYVDDARAEFGEPRDFYHGLQMGQCLERSEVYASVLQGLRDAAEMMAESEAAR